MCSLSRLLLAHCSLALQQIGYLIFGGWLRLTERSGGDVSFLFYFLRSEGGDLMLARN